MTDDRLKQLLHRADATATPPMLAADDLATRVRAALSRQRMRRMTGATLAAAAAIAAVAFLIPRSPQKSVTPPGDQAIAGRASVAPIEAEISRDELDRLRRDADVRMALHTATREKLRGDTAPTIDPLLALRVEADSTASVLLERATHLDRELGLRDVAIGRYREVLESFPASDAATLAQQRLSEMERGS